MQLPYRPQSSPRVSAHLHPGGTYPTFPFDAPSGYPVQLVEQENIDGPTQNQDLQTQHQIRQLAVSLVRTPCPDRPRLTHGSNKPALKVNRKAIVSANRPIKPRKKKAPTLNADAWQPYKARIIELYREHDLPLKAVKAKIEEEYPHFTAELRQYQMRLGQWGFDKNVKPNEMEFIFRKRQQRRLLEPEKGDLVFEVRGHTVNSHKIDRWGKSRGYSEHVLPPSPCPPTPVNVSYSTSSDLRSPAPNPDEMVADSSSADLRPPSVAPTSTRLIRYQNQSPSQNLFSGHGHSSNLRQAYIRIRGIIRDQQNNQKLTDEYRDKARERELVIERLRETVWMSEITVLVEPRETLENLYELGLMLERLGKLRSAEEVMQRFLQDCQSCNDGQLVYHGMESLGAINYHLDHLDKAVELYERTLTFRKITLGSNHDHSIQVTVNLSMVYLDLGRDLAKNDDLLYDLLMSRKRLYGEYDFWVINIMGELSRRCLVQGRLEEAEELLTQAIGVTVAMLGPVHEYTLYRMRYLVQVYSRQGKLEEAESLAVPLADKMARIFGEGHLETLLVMAELAVIYLRQGRWEEAQELFVRTLEASRKEFEEDHWFVRDLLYCSSEA